MSERFPFWYPLAVLAGLALLTFWLDQTIRDSGARDGINEKEPDSIVENFTAISTDSKGFPRYRLTATRLRHYSDSKVTFLDQPVLSQSEPKRGEMRVVSRTALVSPGGDKVTFSGDVKLNRENKDAKGNLQLKTSELEVLPERGFVSTRQPVIIERPGMTVHANGLRLSANTRVLKLGGRVKVQYQKRRA